MLDVDYKTDLALCRDVAIEHTIVRGTLDPSSVMRLGTPEDVDEMCRVNIEMLGGGKFFLNAGCDIMPETPRENVRAMVQAARRYRPLA